MSNIKTVYVPHLGGIHAAYQMPHPYDSSKPTLVLVSSFSTSSELYRSQYANTQLTNALNLLAIDLLGHGQTRSRCEHFTYWDTAIMNLQVLDALKIGGKVFVLGTSQGGWITARMALLAPDMIAGIIPLGTSLDSENDRTVALGCWPGPALLKKNIEAWTSDGPTPNFEPATEFCDFLIDIGFGNDVDRKTRAFWHQTIKWNYQGDDGRRRIRMAAINLAERDGLHSRLSDIRCPVLWLHGAEDVVFSVENAKVEIKLFVNSPDAKLQVVKGGKHFLSFSHAKDVDDAVLALVRKYGK